MNRSICRLLLSSPLVMIATVRCDGQTRDIQLSPPEPIVSHSLPSDIRVQSAASLGSGTLVVWGSYELDRHGIGRNVLRVQHLHGSTPDRPVMIAHSEAARPTMPVHVGALPDGYILYWHDLRRDAPGLYTRRFDRFGSPIDDERRIAEGVIVDLLTHPSVDGFQPLMTVDRRPDPSAPYRYLPPLLLHGDGRIESRPMPQGRLTHRHIIASDSSFVELNEELRFYRHFLDTTPQRVMSLDTLHALSISLVTDTAGRPSLIYTVRADNGSCRGVSLHRASLRDDGTIEPPSTLDLVDGCAPSGYTVHLEEFGQTPYEGGIRLRRRQVNRHSDGSEPLYLVDSTVHFIGPRGSYDRSLPSTTERWGEEAVTRVSSDTVSRVAMIRQGVPVTMESAVAGVRTANPDDRPKLMSFGDSVYLMWNRTVDNGSGSEVITSSVDVNLARWPHPGDTCASPVDTNRMVRGGTSYEDNSEIRWTNWGVDTWPGGAAQLHWIQVYSKTSSGYYRDAAGTRNIVATPNGWRQIDSVPMMVGRPPYDTRTWTFDPNDRTLTIPFHVGEHIFRRWTPELRISVVDSSGSTVDAATLDSIDGEVIPISRGERLVLNGGVISRAVGDSIAWSKPFQVASGFELQLQRVFGEYFIRTWLDSADRSLVVERFTLDGETAGSYRAATSGDARSVVIAVDPSDSSIAFVYMTTSGIRATYLTQDLRPRVVDRLLFPSSSTVDQPSALFHKGQLHLAWTDNDRGGGDVRGMIVDGATLRVESLEEALADIAMTVVPNPSSDRVEVSIETEERNVVIDLIDLQGRTLQTRRAERTATGVRATFDLAELPASTYLAVARIGSTRVARRLVKR